MAISYVAIGTRIDTAVGTPTLPYPAGITSGDFLVACVHHKPTATAMDAPTSALVWTDTGASIIYQKVYTATYDGLTAAPTINTASLTTYGIMFALRCSNPIVVDKISDLGATQLNMRYPALTLTNDNEFVITYCRTNSAITSVAPTDATWTEIEDANLSTSTAGVQICYQIQTTRTNIVQGNPVITGSSSAAVHGITLAFTEGPYVPANRLTLLGVG